MSSKIHEQKVKMNQFPSSQLVISQNDVVEYIICQGDSPDIKSSKQSKKNYFIFQIKQLQIRTGRLYPHNSFKVTFNTPGVYFIQCLNFPSMNQTIKVEQPCIVHNKSQSLCDKSTQYLEEDTASCKDTNELGLTKHKILPFEFNFHKPKKDDNSEFLKIDKKEEMLVDFQFANSTFMDSEIEKTYLSECQNVDTFTLQTHHDQPSISLAERNDDEKQYISIPGDDDTICCIPELKEEVIEHIQFSKFNFEEVTEVLQNFKNKYGTIMERNQKNSLVFASLEELSSLVLRDIKLDSNQIKFPKGLSNRKLRRANQKIEARF